MLFFESLTYFLTGKTHTLMAPDGIAQSIIQKVFDQIQTDGGNDYKVSNI